MFGRSYCALILAAAALPALADDYRYGRDRGRGRDGWERDEYYRQSRLGTSVVDRTLSDLRRAASRNRVDGHERNHFERAMYHLDRFRYRLERESRFDAGSLNDAIGHIDDLADARQIHPMDRQMLARDLHELRRLRSNSYRDSYGRW